MPDATLAKKLQIKPGHRLLVLDAPRGYHDALEAPPGVEVAHRASRQFDVVQLFVKTKAELERRVPVALKACKPAAIVWICWPKSSKLTTDRNRDILFNEAQRFGLRGVANVSIDETWSALRFKRIET